MSISRIPRAKPGRSKAGGGDRPSPLTVSHPALLDDSSDRRFRQLVYDLLTLSVRMNAVREHLARRMDISGPQYSVLIAVSQLQGEQGVGGRALARMLHVSTAFIATETGKLAQAGLVGKRPNPEDRRGVLISLTRAGKLLIERNRAEIRLANDQFFGSLSRSAFEAMSSGSAALVGSSAKVMSRLMMLDHDASIRRSEAAE